MESSDRPTNGQLIVRPAGAIGHPMRHAEFDRHPHASGTNSSEWIRFADLLKLLFASKGLLALGLLTGLIASILVTRSTQPLYRASAAIEVQGLNEELLDLRNTDPTAKPGSLSGDTYVQTQAEILQDSSLLEKVRAALKLEKRAEFQRPPGLTQRLGRRLGLVHGEPLPPAEQALEVIRERLTVMPSRQSRIIRVSFYSADPVLAAAFVNELGRAFIEANIEARSAASTQVRDWLRPQLESLKQRVERSEAELEKYTRESGLVFTGDRESVAEEKLRQLQRDLAVAQNDKVLRQSLFESVQGSSSDSLPPGLDTTALRELRARLTELRRQRAEVESLFTSESQRVQRVQAQIDEVEAAYKREATIIAERAKNDFDASQRREDALSTNYSSQVTSVLDEAKKKIDYNTLKHEVDNARLMYDTMSHKAKEADVAAVMKPSNVRILNRAKPPSEPWRPNLPVNFALGLASGLCLGVLLAVFQETFRESVSTPADASYLLHLPSLGTVPKAGFGTLLSTASTLYSAVGRLIGNDANGSGRKLARWQRPSVELVTWRQKNSQVSESFREILSSILLSGKCQVLLLTSPTPGDGKTTICSNLAVALGETGKRVLVIDGDLRNPRMHKVFNLSNDWGLSNVLSGSAPVSKLPSESVALPTEVHNVFLLPSGAATSEIFPLFNSPRLGDLMTRLRRDFDYVLVDTPPVLRSADVRLLAQVGDAAVLVVRAKRTNRHMAREAAECLETAGVRVLGAILNDWDVPHYNYYRNYFAPEAGDREASDREVGKGA
jgi:polysaccharide biosynthesis transport protein